MNSLKLSGRSCTAKYIMYKNAQESAKDSCAQFLLYEAMKKRISENKFQNLFEQNARILEFAVEIMCRVSFAERTLHTGCTPDEDKVENFLVALRKRGKPLKMYSFRRTSSREVYWRRKDMDNHIFQPRIRENSVFCDVDFEISFYRKCAITKILIIKTMRSSYRELLRIFIHIIVQG